MIQFYRLVRRTCPRGGPGSTAWDRGHGVVAGGEITPPCPVLPRRRVAIVRRGSSTCHMSLSARRASRRQTCCRRSAKADAADSRGRRDRQYPPEDPCARSARALLIAPAAWVAACLVASDIRVAAFLVAAGRAVDTPEASSADSRAAARRAKTAAQASTWPRKPASRPRSLRSTACCF
jgi:hypothetical protein